MRVYSALLSFALGILWLYKRTLSPLLYFFGVRCRHAPGCSDYAVEAFKRFGIWRGFWMTLFRLGRCHPLGTHGWDPVPESQPDADWRFWRFGRWSWKALDDE